MPNRRLVPTRALTERNAAVIRIDQARVALRQLRTKPRIERATRTVLPIDGSPLPQAVGEVVVAFTQNSVWIVTDLEYRRMPRNEFAQKTRMAYSDWGRLNDNVWLAHRGAYWVMARPGFTINIRPTAGPEGGVGILTGTVEGAVSFDLDFD